MLRFLTSAPIQIACVAMVSGGLLIFAGYFFQASPVLIATFAVIAAAVSAGIVVRLWHSERFSQVQSLLITLEAGGRLSARDLDDTLHPFIDRVEQLRVDQEKQMSRAEIVARMSEEVIVDIDVRKQAYAASATLTQILGLAPDALVGSINWLFDQIHPAERAMVEHGLHRFIEGYDVRFELSFRFIIADREERWISAVASAVRGTDGVATRIILLLTDVTERKRQEAAQSGNVVEPPL